jgi:hypothetical protein
LQEHIRALQQELMAKPEANFDLQSMMATMEAEQVFNIKSVKMKAKEETSKLHHALRLEQQTTQ